VGLLATTLINRRRKYPRSVAPYRPLEPRELPWELPSSDEYLNQDAHRAAEMAEAVALFYQVYIYLSIFLYL